MFIPGVIAQNGIDTIVLLGGKGSGYGLLGTAHCLPEDRFSRWTGFGIALLKAHRPGAEELDWAMGEMTKENGYKAKKFELDLAQFVDEHAIFFGMVMSHEIVKRLEAHILMAIGAGCPVPEVPLVQDLTKGEVVFEAGKALGERLFAEWFKEGL